MRIWLSNGVYHKRGKAAAEVQNTGGMDDWEDNVDNASEDDSGDEVERDLKD